MPKKPKYQTEDFPDISDKARYRVVADTEWRKWSQYPSPQFHTLYHDLKTNLFFEITFTPDGILKDEGIIGPHTRARVENWLQSKSAGYYQNEDMKRYFEKLDKNSKVS